WWLDGGGFWSHLHALAWFAAVVWAAARVQRLLFGAAEARWATPLFALSSIHVMPLAFTAALHAPVSPLFAVLSFECLIGAVAAESDGQADRAVRPKLASLGWFVIALAGGESAVTLLPIAAAYVWAERGWRRACALLTPHLLATLLF